MTQFPEIEQFRQALLGLTDTMNNASNGSGVLARETADAGQRIKDAQATQKQVIDQTVSSLKSFGTAILNTERSFSKYNGAIDSAGGALATFAKTIPGVGNALSMVVKGGTEVAKMYTEQADRISKANDTLKQLGTAGSFTGETLLKFAHNANLTSKNLEYLTKPIQSLGTGILALGRNTGEGVESFAKIIAITNKQREEYQRLGVSQEQLIQNQADYITLQQMSATNLAKDIKDTQKMQKLTLEYTDSLQVLSSMTGQSAEQVKKQQQEAANDRRFQVSQINMENKARELERQGRTEEAKKVREEAKARSDLLAQLSPRVGGKMATQIAGYLASGNFNLGTKELAQLSGQGFDVRGMREALSKGEDPKAVADRALKQFTDAQGKMIKTLGQAAVNNEKVLDVAGLDAEALKTYNLTRDKNFQEERKISEAKIQKAKTEGFDPLADNMAKLTTAEIELSKGFDQLLAATNPLTSKFGELIAVAGGLAAAAVAAAAALGRLAGSAAGGAIGGGGAGGAGGAGGGGKGGGMTLNKFAKGAGKWLGAAGMVLDAGMGINDLMQGKRQTEMPSGLDMISPMRWGMFAGEKIRSAIFDEPGGSSTGKPGAPKPSVSDEMVKNMIVQHEGIRYEPYKDSKGKWTVGVGHLIGDGNTLPPEWNRKFSHQEVMALFEQDYRKHRSAAESIPGFEKFNAVGQAALTDLTFNMGPGWVSKFPNTAKSIAAGDSQGAADGLTKSEWYKQVGNRAPKIVSMISQGTPKAERGGIFSGSRSGYPVELHGNELVAPLNPSSLLAKLLTTPESELKREMSPTSTSSNMGITELMDIMSIVADKLDDVVLTLKASQSTQEQLLKYSKV